MTAEKKVQQQLDRSERRAGRLHYKAEKAREEGLERLDKAHRMVEVLV